MHNLVELFQKFRCRHSVDSLKAYSSEECEANVQFTSPPTPLHFGSLSDTFDCWAGRADLSSAPTTRFAGRGGSQIRPVLAVLSSPSTLSAHEPLRREG